MTQQFHNSPEISFQSATILDLVRYRASLYPEKVAFTFLLDGETQQAHLNYGELEQQARSIAAQLQHLGIRSGERALLLYPPGLEFISAFCGCLYAGVVAIPAYPPRPNQSLCRLQTIIADAQATIVLTTKAILFNLERQGFQSSLQGLHRLATDDIPSNLAQVWQEPVISSDTLAFLQYTSGSTGTPKGVIVSHRNLLHNERIIQQAMQHTEKSIVVSWLPLFHDMGLIGNMLQPLYLGIPCIFMSPIAFLQRPWRWLQAISNYKATSSGGPNFAYDLCVRKITPEQRATLDLSSWEVAFSGAEPVRAETLEQFTRTFADCGFRREAFYPCYGMAEATLFISGGIKSALPVRKILEIEALEKNQVVLSKQEYEKTRTFVSCGQPWLDQEIVIVNPNTLTSCQNDEVGEIWVSGQSVAGGYWNRPMETESTFQAYLADTGVGPFLRTGDLGFVQDGELFITGRLKDLIIIRGRNHYPQDIELTVEQSHPGLRPNSGAAFSVDVNGVEQLVIAQEVEREYLRKLDVDKVKRAISQAVAEHHELEVHAIVLLKTGSIPKTSSGKIQRRACRAGFLAGSLDVVGNWCASPHNEVKFQHLLADIASLEQQLRSKQQSSTFGNIPDHQLQKAQSIQAWIVAKIAIALQMNSDDIDVRQSFTYYGLGSMEIVNLSSELEDWLGSKLSPTLAYNYPTIQALAEYLAGVSREHSVALTNEDFITDTRQITDPGSIAIIGMGCRFPGAKNPEDFWDLLQKGVDAIAEVPQERLGAGTFYNPNPAGQSTPVLGGFLEQVDGFDTQFFGIKRYEAERMDPQQRLLLEVTWEALENAGLAPEKLAGSQTGVFIGTSSHDYSRLPFKNAVSSDAYKITGNAHSITANRLSYLLDLLGPSLAIDTACSSSLVAIHMACQSLRSGESDMALVGGVNLILSPELSMGFQSAGIMAADGRCKTFDAKADGYVRSEGCGMVVLKPLSAALRDGDQILALIKGSAINQDGHSNGLTAPNGLSQQRVVRRALENAKVKPSQISYVEAHGTGTPLGDPIEVNSLKAVLMEGRSLEQPCFLGSVKTNIGHLEAAAGIAGLIKVVLSLQHQEIPPHLHLETLNPHISLDGTTMRIPTESQPWLTEEAGAQGAGSRGRKILELSVHKGLVPHNLFMEDEKMSFETLRARNTTSASKAPPFMDGVSPLGPSPCPSASSLTSNKHRFAGVSSFGFGGTNAHVILAEASCVQGARGVEENHLYLLPLSARSPEALDSLVQAYQDFLTTKAGATVSLWDMCYTASVRRSHYNHRSAFVFHSREELAQHLEAFRQKHGHVPISSHPKKLVFVFSGQGTQWWGMGRTLLEQESVFRATIEQCNRLLRHYTSWSLLDELKADESQSRLHQTEIAQPVLFAVQVALANLWRSWGIVPDAVVGHSMGEVAAAYVSGALSLPDAMQVIYHRSRLLEQLTVQGKMAAVELSIKEAKQILLAYQDRLCIAASNSPNSVVLSGDSDALGQVLLRLQQQGVFCWLLQGNYAFHSPQVEPLQSELVQALQGISPKTATIPLFSTVTGQCIDGHDLDADYWSRNLRQLVRFRDAVDGLVLAGHNVFVELGPHPVLSRAISECCDYYGQQGVALSSLRRGVEAATVLRESLSTLYRLGYSIDWSQIYSLGGQCVALPTYPWQRERCWLEQDLSIYTEVKAQNNADILPDSLSSKIETLPNPLTRDTLVSMTVSDRQQILESYFRTQLTRVLGLSELQMNWQQPLYTLGIDSLMAMELKHRIETDLGVTMRMAEFLQCSTLTDLATKAIKQLDELTHDEWEEGVLV